MVSADEAPVRAGPSAASGNLSPRCAPTAAVPIPAPKSAPTPPSANADTASAAADAAADAVESALVNVVAGASARLAEYRRIDEITDFDAEPTDVEVVLSPIGDDSRPPLFVESDDTSLGTNAPRPTSADGATGGTGDAVVAAFIVADVVAAAAAEAAWGIGGLLSSPVGTTIGMVEDGVDVEGVEAVTGPGVGGVEEDGTEISDEIVASEGLDDGVCEAGIHADLNQNSDAIPRCVDVGNARLVDESDGLAVDGSNMVAGSIFEAHHRSILKVGIGTPIAPKCDGALFEEGPPEFQPEISQLDCLESSAEGHATSLSDSSPNNSPRHPRVRHSVFEESSDAQAVHGQHAQSSRQHSIQASDVCSGDSSASDSLMSLLIPCSPPVAVVEPSSVSSPAADDKLESKADIASGSASCL